MNKLQIEARLERSLRNQVRAPKLDGRFDAAVWARIESEKSAAASVGLPVKSSASRWLFASNVIGVLVAVALAAFFGIEAFSDVGRNVSIPEVSPGLVERTIYLMTWPVTIIALGSGLMFTSFGRRLRAEFF
jgi:hypothetical protein